MVTFALGTGKRRPDREHDGFGLPRLGRVLFGVLILPLLAYPRAGLNAIAAFWIAYVLTRPLGASFADWL